MITITCVLKSGGDFTPEYVRRLRKGVTQHLKMPHRFICLSDIVVPCSRIKLIHNWPKWWSKLELFALPETLGDVLYFDLDTVVIGDISDIAAAGRLTMLNDFHRPGHFGSGVMYLPPQERWLVWKEWNRDPQHFMDIYEEGGDQQFLENILPPSSVAFFQDLVPGQIISYKLDKVRQNGVPPDARVVCFHGLPRPHTVGWSLGLRPWVFIGGKVADSWAPEVSVK